MHDFIKLTIKFNKKPIWLHIRNIVSIQFDEKEECTDILTVESDQPFKVIETDTQIIEMIEEKYV